ncbi:MAG: hypothetical protein E7352_06335 [Clostridiales bacterium]|nr:hypothetical protein [Clostridiales bacterium]
MKKEKDVKWKLPKKRQPIWRVFKFIFNPIFRVKRVEYLGEQFPEKCIIIANHNNKKGPMVYEFSLPIRHVTWGAYQMLGSYKMRFKYLRDVLYIQKNGVKKWKATLKAGFESIFSIYTYRGMKVIPSYPDARFRKTLHYSMQCLDEGFAISLFPEDSNAGYFDEMRHFFSGFVMLSEQYYKKTGEDLPIFPIYYGRKKKKIVVGKPLYVQDFVKQGLKRDEIAEKFRLEVNALYQDHFKE